MEWEGVVVVFIDRFSIKCWANKKLMMKEDIYRETLIDLLAEGKVLIDIRKVPLIGDLVFFEVKKAFIIELWLIVNVINSNSKKST